jgi:hypothetical protein
MARNADDALRKRDCWVIEHVDNGRVPIRVFLSKEAAVRWCVRDAEDYLARKKHPRSGVNPVKENEIASLGYDIMQSWMLEE